MANSGIAPTRAPARLQQHELRQPAAARRWRSRSRSAPRGTRGARRAARRRARSTPARSTPASESTTADALQVGLRVAMTRHRSAEEPAMKKIEAIVKPFKLDEVREALSEVGVTGPDRHRGQGLRPAEGPHRALPRRRVRGRLPAQGEDRGGGPRRPGRARHRRDRQVGAHRQDRRRQDLRHLASSTWCASAPARRTKPPSSASSFSAAPARRRCRPRSAAPGSRPALPPAAAISAAFALSTGSRLCEPSPLPCTMRTQRRRRCQAMAQEIGDADGRLRRGSCRAGRARPGSPSGRGAACAASRAPGLRAGR